MGKEAKITWTQVLEAVRKVAPEIGDAFFVDQVVAKLSIDSKEAARWMTRFVDWGYAVRGDYEASNNGRRPRRTYHITKYGTEKELGGISDVDRLLGAIRVLREAQGEAQEKRAITALFKAHDFVVEARENRFQKKD